MAYNVTFRMECAQPFLGPSLGEVCRQSQFIMFMSLLDTFIRGKREVAELCERVRPVNPADYYYNFIVVGGGTAGAVVANRLSENPKWKVLLLEAGPDEPPGADVPSMVAMFLGSEIDWKYATSNETNACLSTGGSCSWPRGKNLGGTSVHNGMMYIRGHAKDYDNWAEKGNPEWTWSEVVPYFIHSENNGEIDRVGSLYHGEGGPLNVERFPWQPPITQKILDAALEMGYGRTEDLNGDKITGFTIAQTTSRSGIRQSTATAFLRPIRNRQNLDIALNATATKIIIRDRKAIGVEYVQNGESRTASSSEEIIVSAGAIDSPKLLLLSGIGPRKHLEDIKVPVIKDLPGVGENLHNHVSYTLRYTINEPNVYDLTWASTLEYMYFQKGVMASTGLSQVTGIVASSYTTPDHPDLQFYFGGYQAACATTGALGSFQDADSGTQRSISVTPTNLHPLSKGNLRLASSNPMMAPIIWGNYLDVTRDVDVLVEGIQIALALMNSTSMTEFNTTLSLDPIPACMQLPPLSLEYWRCAVKQNTGPENHQAGSCKMGPANDPMAVVDSQLRVYGIRNLRVADTSIMPDVTSGNTASPAIMIGEKVAEFIKREWEYLSFDWRRKFCKDCGPTGLM